MVFLDTNSLSKLTVADLRQVVRGRLSIPHSVSSRKATFINFLLSHAAPSLRTLLCDAIECKKNQTTKVKELVSVGGKRKRADDQRGRRTVRRLTVEFVESRDTSQFLKLPADAQVRDCYRQFYAATSNGALSRVVCGVCARELFTREKRVYVLRLMDIPHVNRLRGLLEIRKVDCRMFVSVRIAWPSWRIQVLVGTSLLVMLFPEQMLIALLYPRVYVFKLYPKDLSFRPDSASLQRGLRGNVTTYELDVEGVAAMIQGRLMPRPVSVLSSVISITFIGRGTLPRHCLRSVFRVRRFSVSEALRWLKEHNPKYYGDIDINSDRLRLLPDDDIPEEILSVVRQSSDVDVVDQEGAGYIPLEDGNFKSGLFISASVFVFFDWSRHVDQIHSACEVPQAGQSDTVLQESGKFPTFA